MKKRKRKKERKKERKNERERERKKERRKNRKKEKIECACVRFAIINQSVLLSSFFCHRYNYLQLLPSVVANIEVGISIGRISRVSDRRIDRQTDGQRERCAEM